MHWTPSLSTLGSTAFILLGPLEPSTLVSYSINPSYCLTSSMFLAFPGFLPVS